MSAPCPHCGATFSHGGVSCADGFAVLMALDHSHREPWGSRHGLAFAAYILQHPALRHRPPVRLADWGAPPLPERPDAPHYAVTIADLGDFDAQTYAAELDRWCRAVLNGWQPAQGTPVQPSPRN